MSNESSEYNDLSPLSDHSMQMLSRSMDQSGGKRKRKASSHKGKKVSLKNVFKKKSGSKRRRKRSSSSRKSRNVKNSKKSSKSKSAGKRRRRKSSRSRNTKKSSKSSQSKKAKKSKSSSRRRRRRASRGMPPAALEFGKFRDLIIKEMKDEGVNFPIALRMAKIYKDKAGSTSAGVEAFKKDSGSGRKSVMNKAKELAAIKKPRKSRKSKKGKGNESE